MTLSAVIYVKNLETMSSFYEIALGLVRQESSADDFGLLFGEGFTVSLVVMSEARTLGHVDISPQLRRSETPIKLCFQVDDMESVARTIASFGGVVNDTSSAWDWNGIRHLDFIDPEGNVVQIRQTSLLGPRVTRVLMEGQNEDKVTSGVSQGLFDSRSYTDFW